MVRVSPGTHMRTQNLLTDGDTQRLYPLPDQKCSPRGSSGVSHPYESPAPPCLAYYTSATPLLLFSRCSVFLPIINQCQAIQQQGRHSFPACLFSSSDMSLCPDPPPPPTRQPPSSFHMAAELEPKAHAANMKGCSEAVLGREKSEEEAFLSLKSFLPLATGGKRDSTVIYIIHGTNGRKQTIQWFKKKKQRVWTEQSWGVGGRCMPVFVPLDPSSLVLPIHHCCPHTHSHCPMFVINLWSSYASLPIKTRLHGKEIISPFLGKPEKKMFHSLCFLLMWTFWWTPQRQQPLTRTEARLLCRRNFSLLRRCWHWPSGLIFQTCSHDSYAFETQEISNFSICSRTVSARYFAITHGCPFIDICGICTFFPPCIFTINLKTAKENPRSSYH